jgi:hypothetical protein
VSIVNEKYHNVFPTISYLSDEVILAQAWKKTQLYIRKHNSYADVLELDCSTIDLKDSLEQWSTELTNGEYKTNTMRLVLAPKNRAWYFEEEIEFSKPTFSSWGPLPDKTTGNTEQRLRPLAHLKIKDQTVATAAMLCLADAIETIQGPSDESDFFKAQNQKVYSYGNRLLCNWETQSNNKKLAKFGWGNSQCYRQYYEDYKTFLKRPRDICQHYASIATPGKSLYIVSLDLKEFYDHINVSILQDELKQLYFNEYIGKYTKLNAEIDEMEFWGNLKNILSWSWAESDIEESRTLNIKLPNGIPQGLVAGGFFSNAYLIGFDQSLGSFLGNEIQSANNNSFILRDYCRYVDDIRIVIELSNQKTTGQVKEIAENWVEKILISHQMKMGVVIEEGIKLNKGKTKVLPYNQLSPRNHISSVMNNLQGMISGTPDQESMIQVIGGLDGLLQLSNQLEIDKPIITNSLELSRITTPHLDVRDDTLKRFVATRLVRSLRLRRSMTDLEEIITESDTTLDNITAGKMLDHEFETAARKLVACWASNPSLSSLLRAAFELYPDSTILAPVIDALNTKLQEVDLIDPLLKKEKKVAEFVAADLLRAAATTIGYQKQSVYPVSASILEFREELRVFAIDLLTIKQNSPWYVKQQAILFLCSIGDHSLEIENYDQELENYLLLHESILFKTKNKNKDKNQLAISLVAQQIISNSKKFVSWFISWMNFLDSSSQKQALLTLFMNRPDLMQDVVESKRFRTAKWIDIIPREVAQTVGVLSSDMSLLDGEHDVSLFRIIKGVSNPFKQENAILLLAKAILIEKDAERKLKEGATVSDITVSSKNWENIQNPLKGKLKVEFEDNIQSSELYKSPPWVLPGNEWMYSFGRILRSCLTGEYDFTARLFLIRENLAPYRGLRSTWYTRRFGLFNHSGGLASDSSLISPWVSELLSRLLQWPGVMEWSGKVEGLDQILNTGDLLRIIEKRLKKQKDIYGHLSNTPFYIFPAPTNLSLEVEKLQVAVVQPLLPRFSDFNVKDPTHWTPSFRAVHRNHIASICNLVNSHLKSKRSATKTVSNNYTKKYKDVDLIIFPELTVHQDDIDLLRGLSDATKANIFAGLTFVQSENLKGPINQALWLLRQERNSGREFITVYQGKKHMTKHEKVMQIQSNRPYQIIIEFGSEEQRKIRIAGAICYDATDLALVADLRDVSDVFVIAAMNQDIQTFDNMVAALHYHMYQPVILANSGEFGGSTVQAPFTKHARQIAHVHGNNQIAVSVFEVDAAIFKSASLVPSPPEVKAPPAGYKGRF